MIRYLKIMLVDGTRFILRVTNEAPLVVKGYEVNEDGDEVVPTGYERRLRIVGRDIIKRAVPMRMNPTYATLEVVQKTGHASKPSGLREDLRKSANQLDAEIAEALASWRAWIASWRAWSPLSSLRRLRRSRATRIRS